jgi:hypothetical protein
MAIYFQNHNETQVSVRSTITLIENANSPKIINYDTPGKNIFGWDNYIKSSLQFAGIFNIGKKQYRRPPETNHS